MENLWPSYCGLESSIPFTGMYDGQRCEGTIGDWNENTCLTESSLILRSDTCSALLIPQGNITRLDFKDSLSYLAAMITVNFTFEEVMTSLGKPLLAVCCTKHNSFEEAVRMDLTPY